MTSPADVALSAFRSIFAGDYAVFDHHPGLAALREHFPPMRVAFPDFTAELKQQVVDGDRVALQWIFRGTHHGPLLGIPATGKPVQFQNVSISRVEDGKIVQYNSEIGWLTVLRQVGAAIVPGAN